MEENNQAQDEIRAALPSTLPAPHHCHGNDSKCGHSCVSDPQARLKAQIREIQSSTSLTSKEKAASVQNLMMKQWNDSRDKIALTRQQSDNEVERVCQTFHVSL
jgi:hypothetical protein